MSLRSWSIWWCDVIGEAWSPTNDYPEGLKTICERESHTYPCGWVKISRVDGRSEPRGVDQ